jgi:NAD(P)H-flavin reductase
MYRKPFSGAVAVTEKRRLCSDTASIKLKQLDGYPVLSPLPGQFGMLTVKSPGWKTPLQRPFSFSGRDEMIVRAARREDGTTGPVSSYIVNEMGEKELALLSGPLGNSFRGLADNAGMFYLLGGGCGMGPLLFLAGELTETGSDFRIFYGAKTADDIMAFEDFRGDLIKEAMIATEDGSRGKRGTVVDLMNEYEFLDEATFCICGPKGMLKTAANRALEFTAPENILISTEPYMKCGRGVCDSCSVNGYRSCTDGPVFRYREIMDAGYFTAETRKSGRVVDCGRPTGPSSPGSLPGL